MRFGRGRILTNFVCTLIFEAMQPTPPPILPLNYQTPPSNPHSQKWKVIWLISLVTASLFIGASIWMFGRSSDPAIIVLPKKPFVVPAPGVNLKLTNPSDVAPTAAASKVLDDLLAGKLDDDPSLGPIARKVNSFQSWSITSITTKDEPPSRTFTGTLNAGDNFANFSIQLVKQRDGTWQVATFIGPNR